MGDNINSFENIFSKVLSTNTNLSDPDEDESTGIFKINEILLIKLKNKLYICIYLQTNHLHTTI